MKVLPHCTGFCRGGRAPCICQSGTTEIANAVPLDPTRTFGGRLERGQVIPIRPTVTGGQVSRWRRVRRWFRDLRDFLLAPTFRP